jgi:hypothetical protein
MRAIMVGRLSSMEQGFCCGLPLLEILLSLRHTCDVVAGISSVDHVLPSGRVIVSSKCGDGAAMTADFGSAMIALGAESIRGCRSP